MIHLIKLGLFIIVLLSFIPFNLYGEEPAVFQSPDLLSGIYDQYSNNRLNASMSGRGNTGISISGGVESAWYNPALLREDIKNFYLELMVKDNTREFNKLADQTYQSPYPITFVGMNFNTKSKYRYALSYSLANSIQYYSFDRNLYGTGDLFYDPTYLNHQLTLTGSYELTDKYSFGLNTLLNFHQFIEYRNEGKADRLNFIKPVFRFQPGFLYKGDYISIGSSVTIPTKATFKESYVNFETTFPTIVRSGISFRYNDFLCAFDADYSRYSEQDSNFKDQLVLKTGMEMRRNIYSLKCGYMYIPSIFKGIYEVPDFSDPTHSEFHHSFYDNIPTLGVIKNADMNVVTLGTTIKPTKDVELNLCVMRDVNSRFNYTQLISSVKFNLSIFDKLKKEK